ncbi:MAG TPA: GNAT family N-acetyltransferase [Pyrinomonadaceae bacterium]|nr:GNAT family N-acetyltransferase [Pyrinomonadaceae bacterium]
MTSTTHPLGNSGTLAATAAVHSNDAPNFLSIQPLRVGQEAEVLSFLAERPLHTFVMAGHIRDNGLESPHNRGSFHACRDQGQRLKGVALIGHATLLETRSDAALAAFAHLAQTRPAPRVLMGEQDKIDYFWKCYAKAGQSPRRVGRELLLEQRWPVAPYEPVPGLRLATHDDVAQVTLVQGEMALAASGINPLEADPLGFRMRCARRIDQKRVWIWVEDGRLIFKADVISDTREVMYLEGIHVDPQDRGKGCGTRCMLQLSQTLLQQTASLCVLVNEQSQRSRRFFERVGFRLQSYYGTIFLE